jgi:hypothetical protein
MGLKHRYNTVVAAVSLEMEKLLETFKYLKGKVLSLHNCYRKVSQSMVFSIRP